MVFDYVEDFDTLLKNIYMLMNKNAQLVFRMSHAMATAWDGTYDRYTRSASGERFQQLFVFFRCKKTA